MKNEKYVFLAWFILWMSGLFFSAPSPPHMVCPPHPIPFGSSVLHWVHACSLSVALLYHQFSIRSLTCQTSWRVRANSAGRRARGNAGTRAFSRHACDARRSLLPPPRCCAAAKTPYAVTSARRATQANRVFCARRSATPSLPSSTSGAGICPSRQRTLSRMAVYW